MRPHSPSCVPSSVAEIVDGGQESAGPGGPPTYSGPILDGRLVVETAAERLRGRASAQVPLIIGSNSADVVGFVNAGDEGRTVLSVRERKAEAIAAYDPDGTTEFAEMLTMVNTDKVWAEPARFTARAFVAKGAPAYIYLFSYVSRLDAGAVAVRRGARVRNPLCLRHAGAAAAEPPWTPKDQEVARMMNTYWANFAKTGDPNGTGLPEWPVTIPARTRSSSSDPTDRRSLLPIPRKLGWT